MSVRFVRGHRGLIAIHVSALAGAIIPVARGQIAPSTLQATSRIAGAISSQTMDSGIIPDTGANQAAVSDSFSGPVQVGTLAIGTANTSVSASSRAGLITLSGQNSDTATVAAVSVLTNTEARQFDSIQITQLPGGQGQLSAVYLPASLVNGAMISGRGGTWSGNVTMSATITDYAPDGTPGPAYTLSAQYTNGTAGPVSHDSGPVSFPVGLHDTLTLDVDETLQTSASAPRGESSTVTAGVTTRFLFVPLSPGLAFTSASGHSYLPLAGDADVDGSVGFSDLLTLAQNYGSSGAVWSEGDFNADGNVDFSDLLALAQDYGQSLDAPQAAALPDPAVAAPAAVAAGLLCQRRRR